MRRNLIYIEEYDIYEYFKGEKAVFSRYYPENENNAEARRSSSIEINFSGGINDFTFTSTSVAVISKNINFSVIPKKGAKSFKKIELNKYIAKYYKNESYFYIGNTEDKNIKNLEYGVYHSFPSNIKKYYSLFSNIDFVIPYDYLAILFIKRKFIPNIQEKHCIFIEKTEDIYKIMVLLNGFSIFPINSFKKDMLNDNLNIFLSKLNSNNIKIDKIITNEGETDFSTYFTGAETISFTLQDFFEFFSDLKKEDISHFENPEVKFKNLELKKRKQINFYIAVFTLLIILMQYFVYFLNGKAIAENQKIKFLNKNIAAISAQINKRERNLLFNKKFTQLNLTDCLKKIIYIFPKGVKIKKIVFLRLQENGLTRGLRSYAHAAAKQTNNYVIQGIATIPGGYRKFAKDYDLILKRAYIFKNVHISYDLNNFGKPSVKFYAGLVK